MTSHMFQFRIAKDKAAATTVEYGLILGLIVLVVIGAINGAAGETIKVWNSISEKSAEASGY